MGIRTLTFNTLISPYRWEIGLTDETNTAVNFCAVTFQHTDFSPDWTTELKFPQLRARLEAGCLGKINETELLGNKKGL